MYYAEPSCGYAMEASCGAPMMSAVSYGPEMIVGGGCCGGGSPCDCCGSAPMTGAPAPVPAESFVDPRPAAE